MHGIVSVLFLVELWWNCSVWSWPFEPLPLSVHIILHGWPWDQQWMVSGHNSNTLHCNVNCNGWIHKLVCCILVSFIETSHGLIISMQLMWEYTVICKNSSVLLDMIRLIRQWLKTPIEYCQWSDIHVVCILKQCTFIWCDKGC